MLCRIAVCIVLGIASSAALADVAEAETATPFTTVLRARFQQWADAKGEITPERLDQLMKRRSIRGEDGAALAAMKRDWREKTTATFVTWNMKRIEEYEAQAAQSKKDASFDKAFKRAMAAIKADPHTLYAKDAPHLDAIHQARNGDCWLLATIGAMISRNPSEVRSFISDDGNRRYTVHFAYRNFKVNAPTDAEIGAYTSDSADGDWLYVLENAVGQYREDVKHLHHVAEANDDALVAGNGVGAFQDILGRNADHVGMSPAKPQDDLVRQTLARAFRHRRLVIAGTTHDKAEALPHGIAKGHDMAVIGWNASTDTVKVWNPWGNTGDPKGTGPEAGYKTVSGVFTMPLVDFTRSFAGIDVENDKPYKPTK